MQEMQQQHGKKSVSGKEGLARGAVLGTHTAEDAGVMEGEAQITGMAKEAATSQNANRKRVTTKAPRWVPPSP